LRRDIVITVPAARPTGPVKGAYALANALAAQRRVHIVTLRDGPGAEAPLDPMVIQHSLAAHRGFRRKLGAYRALLGEAGGRDGVAAISMCFSADLLNGFARDHAFTCASVRGNLVENYRTDYGMPGVMLARLHYRLLSRFDRVTAMTVPMADQMRRLSGRPARVIGNFLDEAALERWRASPLREGPWRFVFLGQLSPRKEPMLAIRALAALRAAGEDCCLEMVGEGPMRQSLLAEIARLGLGKHVTLHGFIPSPYALLSGADVLLLPSLSEGISRAAMEALYLGVPCILRDVEGNGELIQPGWNGNLFRTPGDLSDVMRSTARQARISLARTVLLPDRYRQAVCAAAYLSLAEEAR
jgi:glycosyltransferase involved in cell wall biosynthesis